MSFSLVYLAQRFFYRVYEFLWHWYVNSFYIFSHGAISLLQLLDEKLALAINLRLWFKPLYQDYTIIGYILGFLFRTLRIGVAVALYFCVAISFSVGYLIWAGILPYIIYQGFF